MPLVGVEGSTQPMPRQMAVLRSFSDSKAVLAMLGADVYVLLVPRTSDKTGAECMTCSLARRSVVRWTGLGPEPLPLEVLQSTTRSTGR